MIEIRPAVSELQYATGQKDKHTGGSKNDTHERFLTRYVKARLHGSPRLINTVESMKLNSTVERYFLHGSTKVKEAVDFKMAANELVRKVLL